MTEVSHSLRYFRVKLGKNGRITVPETVRELFHMKEGEYYVFFLHQKSQLQDPKPEEEPKKQEASENE